MTTIKKYTPPAALLHFRSFVAALSSLIPGLGHIYKGHYSTGFEIMIISPFVIWSGLILGWATMGIGILVPVAYLIGVVVHAYTIEDKRHHPAGLL